MAVTVHGSSLVDIVVPVASYHSELSAIAIDSANVQTVRCGVIPVADTEGRGAGYARNLGVSQSSALFVVFLDADDILVPDAVERLLSCYDGKSYVYCDHWQDETVVTAPVCGAWLDGTWHVVTTLLPRTFFQAVGGFDERLPALEDLDLYLRLQAAGLCGVRCPYPLLHYTKHGRRSAEFKARPEHHEVKQSIHRRYGGLARMACNCGTSATTSIGTQGKQDGDVLAQALYSPRQMGGMITGRLYPRPLGAHNYQLWVSPDDVRAMPEYFRLVADPAGIAPDVDAVIALARG